MISIFGLQKIRIYCTIDITRYADMQAAREHKPLFVDDLGLIWVSVMKGLNSL